MNKHIKGGGSVLKLALTLVVGLALVGLTGRIMASGGGPGGGGGSGGGGGVQTPTFSGNWSGTITTPFGTGAFTMAISQSQSTVSGSVHFGAPIFDSTRKLAGTMVTPKQFSGNVSNGEGSLPLSAVLSADGTTITGTVIQGQVYTYTVTRK